jgi:hypothetical protein
VNFFFDNPVIKENLHRKSIFNTLPFRHTQGEPGLYDSALRHTVRAL